MVQKILRTMQDDLRAIKETKDRGQQGRNNPSKEEQREKESPAQIKNDLQQPIANEEKPQTLVTGQKAPVLSSSDSDSNGKNSRDEEIAKIKEELEKIPANATASILANQEEERAEKEKKELEEQRKKIEEMQKKAEEEAKLEEEIRRAEEEVEKQRIEEERRQAEEKAKLEAEQKAQEEAERQRIEEEKARMEEEKTRLQAEEDARRKAQEEEERREETETSEAEKGKQEIEEEERKALEEKQRRIERERERIEELKKREEELDELKERQEKIKMEEEIERKIEEERKAREEDEMHRMEELKSKEEEIKRAEEEARRQEEELAKQEEAEIRKTEEEAKRMEEEAEKIKMELAKKEEDLQRMEKEEKERIEELIRNEEEMKEAEKELERKEKELEQREKERRKREEMRKKMRAEILEGDMPEEGTAEDIIDKPGPTDEITKEDEPYPIIPDKDNEAQSNENLEKSEEYPVLSSYKIEEEMEEAQAAPEEKSYHEAPLTNLSPESGAYAGNIQASKGDKELSSLVRRVSNAMNTTVKQEESAASTAPQNPDKDKDIKELIARMSKNLEKEKEMLEKEQQENKASSQQDLTETESERMPKAKIEIESAPAPEPKPEPLPIIPDEQPEEHPAESAAPSQPFVTQTATATKTDSLQTEKPADSYWAELHNTLKNSTDKPDTQTYADPEETGLIVPKETAQEPTKPAEESLLPKRTYPKKPSGDDYADPENRLIFGRQEFYSSMHKKVKPKTSEANLEELKETVKEDEVKLSDEEEKKKLRHQIITKYKIELFSMPWAKIVIFSFLFLATLGITLYVLIPRFIPKEQVTETIITGESITEVDKLIPQKIVAKQKEVSALGYFDSEIDPWKSLADRSVTRLTINNNEHELMLPRDEALKIVLGEENFKNVPQDVLGFLDNKYNILAFKNNDILRLGIVLKYNRNQEEDFKQSMTSWAETPAKAQKIHNIMKALFVNSKVEEKSSTTFQPSSYSNVNIYYLNLPDTDTSMDYFMYKGYLVFTTSKNTTSEIIDLLQQ